MPRKRKERPRAEIETGSFSDISFLLIIFFVLTTSLSRPTGRMVDIPSAAPPEQQKAQDDKSTSVSILADRVMLATGGAETGSEVTLPELRTALAELGLAARPEKERMIVVEVADDVPWERYFQVASLIAETGGVVALVEKEGEGS